MNGFPGAREMRPGQPIVKGYREHRPATQGIKGQACACRGVGGGKKLQPGLKVRATAASVRNFGYLVQSSKQQQGSLAGRPARDLAPGAIPKIRGLLRLFRRLAVGGGVGEQIQPDTNAKPGLVAVGPVSG